MCDHVLVTYECKHTSFWVLAWCTKYQNTYVKCGPNPIETWVSLSLTQKDRTWLNYFLQEGVTRQEMRFVSLHCARLRRMTWGTGSCKDAEHLQQELAKHMRKEGKVNKWSLPMYLVNLVSSRVLELKIHNAYPPHILLVIFPSGSQFCGNCSDKPKEIQPMIGCLRTKDSRVSYLSTPANARGRVVSDTLKS